MVQASVPLVRIGQVLRHRSLQSTAIYARVDLERLRAAGGAVAGRCAAMSGLQAHVEDYLRLRRALGFKLERGAAARQFVGYLEAAGATTVTSELAISWARLPEACIRTSGRSGCGSCAGSPATCKRSTRRPRSRRRRVPDLASAPRPTCGPSGRLPPVGGARALRPPLRAASHEALFGLLAVSGMRIGEAIALEREDVDLERA